MICNQGKISFLAAFLMSTTFVHAEMEAISDDALENISGQGGVYLSGEISLNKEGGPLWSTTSGVNDDFGTEKAVRNCGSVEQPEECGIRIAMKVNTTTNGWYVIDDLSGGFSFEGLTLRTKNISTALDYDAPRGQDGLPVEVTLPDGGAEVLEIGLPNRVSLDEFKFNLAVANNGEWGVDPDSNIPFQQTELFGVRIDGDVTLKGNLLLFPVD